MRTRVVPGKFRAFTMVELLLVMALLVAMLSIAAPVLANFFRGRTLDSEARRFLALTHSGQSRAVTEGIPMVLWVDVDQHRYGLEAEPGWEDQDAKAVEFPLDPDLQIEVINATKPKPASTSSAQAASQAASQAANAGPAAANARTGPRIRFMPDGSFGEPSLQAVRIYDQYGALFLEQSQNHLNYEIRSELIQ
jgi:type II secretory pathway pseudopilin PulG